MKKVYIVEKKDTLLNYLYETWNLPKKKIKQYLTHGNIYVNHVRITKFDYPLEVGTEIKILEKQEQSFPFPILYEDPDIIVVEKPSGLLTIATEKEKNNTLYHYVGEYLRKRKKNAKVFVVHRLDKDTSGIVLFAKNPKIKEQLQKNWQTWVKVREYQAIVVGVPRKKEDRLIHYLKETTTNLVYVSKEGKKAITSYKVEKSKNGFSLLRIFIETGRKNQIRVQLAHIGYPIYGDLKYQKKKEGKRLYLHATRLKVFHPTLGKVLTFTSPLPPEFNYIMR